MDDIEKELAELNALKAKQALHRRQLEENRKRALAKSFVSIGKMVENILPDADSLSEDEIRKILSERLNMRK